MDEDSSIHWHGLLVPASEDGVPGFNGFGGIRPHQTYTYRFTVRQSGTYWYHAHSMGQEQDGLYAGIVIHPKGPDPIVADRDYVVLLSDYAHEDSKDILKHLKMSSDYYQYHQRTLMDLGSDIKKMGLSKALEKSRQWGQMRMLPTDLSDVTGYVFLMNGMSNAQNWTGLYKPGERVRLRFINASAMTISDVRIEGLRMTVVAADGRPVTPVTVDEFRFGNAETYDVIVTPTDDRPHTIIAESLDREGFALGTLATHIGQKGDMPKHRPRAQLTMSDMNMAQMMMDDPNMDMSAMPDSGWADHHAPVGTRILSYADLRPLVAQTDVRAPTREIMVRLGGNMERYVWTINGKVFDPRAAIDLAFDERVRLIYVNETMMAHPVHLHGMFVQLENGDDPALWPDKHTLIVPPGQTVSVVLSANEVGRWPLHCHLFFHMASGMMTSVIVHPLGDKIVPPAPPTVAKEMNNHVH
jgi:FtsP/CotA-like multicopper oxidase with cupredoxin domain